MPTAQFRHTQYAVYITALATALSFGYDSAQGIVQKYHINKKWFYLYGIMTLFAYLYVRPLIRKRLGSASTAYINWNTMYAVWLCSAVFYHMPSFESLGFDIKADVSIMLTTFLMSCALLGSLAGTYGFVTSLRSVSKRLLYVPPSSKEMFGVVVMNSMSLALACSTYYSFCGNSPGNGNMSYNPDDAVRNYICRDVLKPLSPHKHKIFSGWVLYGGLDSSNETLIDTNDGHVLETHALLKGYISPVFTTWLTMFLLFICNSSADFAAVYCINTSSQGLNRQRSGLKANGLRKNASKRLSGKSPDCDMGSFGSLADLDSLLGNSLLVGPLQKTVSLFTTKNDGVDDDDGSLSKVVIGRRVLEDTPGPMFLPMFPWYSGTSADLLNTLFDLIVSVKVFVGRFDMRTLLAATSLDGSSKSIEEGPCEGDGYLYEHLSQKKEVWLDFCADTGDGGNSTYSIARCLASPEIKVFMPEEIAANEDESGGVRFLPRGETLIHGGDLAYPNPTDETYEERLFSPYHEAFPSPPHVYPGHLVVNKPDLPPEYYMFSGETCTHHPQKLDKESATSECKICMKVNALKSYGGPTAFMIPGNHDWIDGLETYRRNVIHRGWIGGWLLPQEKSYFALKLPQGWWLLGIDLALEEDIDMCQYQYFTKIAEDKMGPHDTAIIVTHCPQWLVDWFWGKGENSGKILRQLIRGPLRGRVKLRLAGDLHFYMRHSFKTYGKDDISVPPSYAPTPAGGSPLSGGSPTARHVTPTDLLTKTSHATLVNKLSEIANQGDCQVTTKGEEQCGDIIKSPPSKGASILSSPRLEGSPPGGWWHGLKSISSTNGSSPPSLAKYNGHRGSGAPAEWQAPPSGWILNDAKELVVCGSGGAFLHPTHVFSYARIRPLHDPSAGPMHIKPSTHRRLGRSYPSTSSLYSMKKSNEPAPSAGGEYRCTRAFPSMQDSLHIGRLNLHAFRNVNSRFDIIGGALYYFLVLSALPRCTEAGQIFRATSLLEAVQLFFKAITSTFIYIFSKSYVSFCAFLILFFIALGFGRGGGVGAISGIPPAARRKPEYTGFALAVKARMGGISAQLFYATIHALLHFFAAIALLILLELGIETVIRYEQVGSEGYHSLYRWYREFESEHFSDPADLRSVLSKWTFGLYPNAIKWLFAVFDVPEAIAVSRSAACSAAGSFASLTRLQTFGYYIGVLLYFWVLATPTVGFLFGVYLYISGNWLHVHYDESFSALQVEDRKAFIRMHIDSSGDLSVYALGIREVPKEWREDPRWKSPGGGGTQGSPSYKAAFPSRWMPVTRTAKGHMQYITPPEDSLEIVDYFKISKNG